MLCSVMHIGLVPRRYKSVEKLAIDVSDLSNIEGLGKQRGNLNVLRHGCNLASNKIRRHCLAARYSLMKDSYLRYPGTLYLKVYLTSACILLRIYSSFSGSVQTSSEILLTRCPLPGRRRIVSSKVLKESCNQSFSHYSVEKQSSRSPLLSDDPHNPRS